MNLPNRLTVSRLVMAPLFFISFFLADWFGPSATTLSIVLTLLFFVLTELSDLFDGMIARKRKLVTDLGKVMDPFADTFSRLTYFVCLTHVDIMPVWAFVIIMWREFSILFLRMLMMGTRKAVPANIWGKAKSVLYAVSGILGILYHVAFLLEKGGTWMQPVFSTLQWIFALAAVASVVSFGTYVRPIVRDGSLSHMSR